MNNVLTRILLHIVRGGNIVDNALAEQDGDVIDRLRALQAQHQDGTISVMEFDAAFVALNQEVDIVTCAHCKQAPARITLPDKRIVCGGCWLAGVRR